LIIAGCFEIAWAVGLKYLDGFKLNLAMGFVGLSMTLSVVFLALAVKTIPISISYAIWTGIGICGVFLFGIFVLKEPLTITNAIFVAMILIGIVGLKISNVAI
jgi:quaternary ammonium compound-resistance protein SugE